MSATPRPNRVQVKVQQTDEEERILGALRLHSSGLSFSKLHRTALPDAAMRTVDNALRRLSDRGLVISVRDFGMPPLWKLVPPKSTTTPSPTS